MRERKLSVGRYLQYLGALRFLYCATLGRPKVVEDLRSPKMRRLLPDTLTREEVARVVEVAATPLWRTRPLMLLFPSPLHPTCFPRTRPSPCAGLPASPDVAR